MSKSKEEKIEELDASESVEKKSDLKEKKSHPLLVTILVVLLLCVFTAFGYALGGVKVVESATGKTVGDSNKKGNASAKEELDINSRLVKFLYNEVTYDVTNYDCYADWLYITNGNGDYSKFEASSSAENIKMRIVGQNLSKAKSGWIDSTNVPNVGDRRKNEIGRVVSYFYTKQYVEDVYKQIYGSDAVLDTSVAIALDQFAGEQLIFDSNTQKYYPYYGDVGGTCGPGGTKMSLSKAYKEGNKIVIYQLREDEEYKTDADVQANNPTITKSNYVYTFELENDGMYKFVSRTLENN